MILNIHSDASYLSEQNARSRASGHFFLGWLPRPGEPIRLNSAIHSSCNILKFVAASVAEAELGALFLNVKQGRIARLILQEMGHPQPPTPISCDNSTTCGIVNDTIKRHRSRLMEMKYFYGNDQVDNKQFEVEWNPGRENLGNYTSEHHEAKHHKDVCPIYLHEDSSLRVLQQAMTPSALQGCVGNRSKGKQAPLSQLPVRHRTRRGAPAGHATIRKKRLEGQERPSTDETRSTQNERSITVEWTQSI